LHSLQPYHPPQSSHPFQSHHLLQSFHLLPHYHLPLVIWGDPNHAHPQFLTSSPSPISSWKRLVLSRRRLWYSGYQRDVEVGIAWSWGKVHQFCFSKAGLGSCVSSFPDSEGLECYAGMVTTHLEWRLDPTIQFEQLLLTSSHFYSMHLFLNSRSIVWGGGGNLVDHNEMDGWCEIWYWVHICHDVPVHYTPPHNPSGLRSDSLGHSDSPRTLLGFFRVVMLYTVLTAFRAEFGNHPCVVVWWTIYRTRWCDGLYIEHSDVIYHSDRIFHLSLKITLA
jgi:hypothetical protein